MSTDNPNVADRTPRPPVDLEDVSASLLEEARSGSGHAAVTLTPAEDPTFRQTLAAVVAGQALDPERWNGPGSLQVVVGAVALSEGGEVPAGSWAPLPSRDVEVTAAQDAVVLLTVVPTA